MVDLQLFQVCSKVICTGIFNLLFRVRNSVSWFKSQKKKLKNIKDPVKWLPPIQSLICPVPLLKDNPCFTSLTSLSFLIIDKQIGIYKGREFPSFTKDCVLFILFFSHKKTSLFFLIAI